MSEARWWLNPSIGKPELLINGDLESYTGTQDDGNDDIFTYWSNGSTGAGDIIESTATAHTGSSAAKITYGNDGCWLQRSLTVVPSVVYQEVFWARGDGVVAGRYKIRDLTNAADIVATTSTGVTGVTYTRVPVSFTTPAGCISIRIQFISSAVAGVAYFDDISLRRA